MYTVHNANDRRSPVLSDTTCPRPNMPTSEGLPQKWRLRTKKLAKIRVRFLTVNSDRVMSIKLVVGKRMLNIISAYAPQTGCSQEEKEHFYEEMESLLRQIPGQEDMWIGAYINGHVGGTITGFEPEIAGEIEMRKERRSYSLPKPMIWE